MSLCAVHLKNLMKIEISVENIVPWVCVCVYAYMLTLLNANHECVNQILQLVLNMCFSFVCICSIVRMKPRHTAMNVDIFPPKVKFMKPAYHQRIHTQQSASSLSREVQIRFVATVNDEYQQVYLACNVEFTFASHTVNAPHKRSLIVIFSIMRSLTASNPVFHCYVLPRRLVGASLLIWSPKKRNYSLHIFFVLFLLIVECPWLSQNTSNDASD